LERTTSTTTRRRPLRLCSSREPKSRRRRPFR